MATRFYFDSAATPGISPAPDAEWDRTADLTRRVLNASKGASSRADSGALLNEPNTITTSNNDLLQGQHISDGLAAQTISGTFKCYLQTRENNAAANWRSQIIIRVVNADGTTVRGTLYAGDLTTLTGNPASEWNASTSVEVNRAFPTGGSTALSSLAVSAGDRLVVETGARQHNTQSTNRNGAIVYGEPAGGDLPEDETDTSTNLAGWIEFSGTIALDTGADKQADDTQALTSSESASVSVAKSGSDSQAITASETTTLSTALTGSDSQALDVGETTALSATATATDSQAISVNAGVSLTAALSATEDTQALTASETTSLVVTHVVTDEQALTASETTSLAVSSSVADNQSLTVMVASTLVASLSATDTQALTAYDVAGVSVPIDATDSQALTTTETVAPVATLTATDSQILTATDDASHDGSPAAHGDGTYLGSERGLPYPLSIPHWFLS